MKGLNVTGGDIILTVIGIATTIIVSFFRHRIIRLIFPSSLLIRITSPENKTIVSQKTRVEGYATKELPQDQYLYIIIENPYRRWWPQHSNVDLVYSRTNKKWEFSVPVIMGNLESSGEVYSVKAVLVDAAIHRRFQEYFREAEEKRKWYGISVSQLSDWGKKRVHDSIIVTRE